MTDAPLADSTNPLSTGDALATAGDWPAAIDAWQRAAGANAALRPAVDRRLAWFLTETGRRAARELRVVPLVIAFVGALVLGIAFLALAGTPGSRSADLWAIATWAMVAVAAVSALLAARRSGTAPDRHLAAGAWRAAEQLDREPNSGEMP
jgi:ABC-type Fe3+ transport system permease subunit